MSLPPDSPLLRSRTASPALQRARSVLVERAGVSLNMSGTSTRSCGDRRASRRPERDSRPRERTPLPAPGGGWTGDLGTKDNLYRNTSPAREVETPQLSFKIKKSLGSRKGWIIMAEDEENCQAQDALKTVIQMIRDMECQVNMSG